MSILNNAADVLRCFSADCTELTVSDIVKRLNMPKANASRLLKAMREAKMLESIGDSHRHRPGRLMLDLAAVFRRSSVLIGRASEVVASVSGASGHTGYISVLDGREVTAVADFPGSNALRVVSNIGRRLPAHISATGRSLLARLTDDEVAHLYAGHANHADLIEQLKRIRTQGYALSSQETTPGVDAIGLALADPVTDEAVSLCIVYPHGLVDDVQRDKLIAALVAGAAPIAQDLGDHAFITPTFKKEAA